MAASPKASIPVHRPIADTVPPKIVSISEWLPGIRVTNYGR